MRACTHCMHIDVSVILTILIQLPFCRPPNPSNSFNYIMSLISPKLCSHLIHWSLLHIPKVSNNYQSLSSMEAISYFLWIHLFIFLSFNVNATHPSQYSLSVRLILWTCFINAPCYAQWCMTGLVCILYKYMMVYIAICTLSFIYNNIICVVSGHKRII